jgi:glutathione S-transferase
VKLYSSPTSPYVMKVRAVAAELGVALELENVAIHAMPSDFGLINPVNRIPALRLDDGSLMLDSRVICEYLDWLKGSTLLPPSGSARWQVLKLQVFGDGLLDAAVPRRAEMNRPAAQQSPPRLAEYERSIRQVLDALDGSVEDLAGVNLGTLAIGCGIGYLDFRFSDEDWRRTRRSLARWYDDFAKRPAMQTTKPVG